MNKEELIHAVSQNLSLIIPQYKITQKLNKWFVIVVCDLLSENLLITNNTT